MDSLFYVFFYLFFLALFINFNSILMFWILLEFNMIMFIMLMLKVYESAYDLIKEQSFLYLTVQCLGSIIFILSFMNLDYFNFHYSKMSFLPIMAIMMKMGMFPFHQWVYKCSHYMNSIGIIFLLSVQKFPLMFFFLCLDDFFMLEALLLNLVMGSIFIFQSFCIKDLLISSSIYSMIWFFSFFIVSPLLFVLFLLNYSIALYCLLKSEFSSLTNKSSNFFLIFYFFSILFVLGLPPAGLFFMKFYSIFNLQTMFSLSMFVILIFFSYLSTLGYFNYFFKFFLSNYNLYFSFLNFKPFFLFSLLLYSFFITI